MNFTIDYPHPYNKIGDGPEGPEVRSIVDELKTYINYNIVDVYISEKTKKVKLDELRIPTKIVDIYSYGKKIIFKLTNKQNIMFGLGMSGKFLLEPDKHSNVLFKLKKSKNTINLYFDDARHFGSVKLYTNDELSLELNKLGPDILDRMIHDDEVSTDEWYKIFVAKPSKKRIADILTDQNKIAGIGWYLMTEILYYSKVHPERPANTLTDEEWESIRLNSHTLIYSSYLSKGLSIKDYETPNRNLGTFKCVVYGKKNDPNGYVVCNKKIGSRTIHWINEIQK